MKSFKYSINILLNSEYWTAKAWLKTRRKELPGHSLLGNGNRENLSFYLSHYYTHIFKQILKYIFSLNKYMLECNLGKSVDFINFAAVNNLTIIFYTVLTKIWFSIIMIQAIRDMNCWFTVANTGQRKPFYQICICSKTMKQISLKLDHRLVMVFMESMVLNPFIKYSGYCKDHTAQCNRPWYASRLY